MTHLRREPDDTVSQVTVSAVGRPRGFDEDELIDRAVDVLWAHGATDTTMRRLERTLGVRQSSLYNTFGSKQRLVHRCIEHYVARVDRELLAPLCDSDAGVEAVIALVERLASWMGQPGRPGCLVLNLVAEVGTSEPDVRRLGLDYRRRLLEALIAPLGGSAQRAELIVAALFGMHARARAGVSRAELRETRDSIIAQLRDWSD